MRNWFNRLFAGRQGMDELSKLLFWAGLAGLLLSGLLVRLSQGLASLLSWLGLLAVLLAFFRAFSRQLPRRDAENLVYLRWLDGRRRAYAAWRERRRQSRDFRFFKCPGCGAMLRVPRGKGKVHIKCKCGYTLYRKT